MFPHFKLLKSPDSALVSTPTYGFTSTLSFSSPFQGRRGRVGGVPVPDRRREEGVRRILQRVQGGGAEMGPLHRHRAGTAAWSGKG